MSFRIEKLHQAIEDSKCVTQSFHQSFRTVNDFKDLNFLKIICLLVSIFPRNDVFVFPQCSIPHSQVFL